MRVDARYLPQSECNWFVWHCEKLKSIGHTIVWFDDDTNEYGTAELITDDIVVHKAKKILVILSSKTVFINPIDDLDNFYKSRKEIKWQQGVPKMVTTNG